MTNFTYVSKPVIVEAFKLSELESNNTTSFPSWLFPAIKSGDILIGEDSSIRCKTKNGLVIANSSDWLIRLDDGEICPCANEVFIKKYTKPPETN